VLPALAERNSLVLFDFLGFGASQKPPDHDYSMGAHMAERIRARLPAARFTSLADVGHWPALEVPARVVAALRDSARVSD
jgi:pimeloyl-ACP methyl ester carboxylesterase